MCNYNTVTHITAVYLTLLHLSCLIVFPCPVKFPAQSHHNVLHLCLIVSPLVAYLSTCLSCLSLLDCLCHWVSVLARVFLVLPGWVLLLTFFSNIFASVWPLACVLTWLNLVWTFHLPLSLHYGSFCSSVHDNAGMKDLKQDTTSLHYGPLLNLIGKLEQCGTVSYWKCFCPMSLQLNYLGGTQKIIFIPNKEDLVLKRTSENAFQKDSWTMPNVFVFQGWRDIKHALVQLELCFYNIFLFNNKNAAFHLKQTLWSGNVHFSI